MGVCGRWGFRHIYSKQESLCPVSMETQMPRVVFCIFIRVSSLIVLKTNQRGTAKGRGIAGGSSRVAPRPSWHVRAVSWGKRQATETSPKQRSCPSWPPFRGNHSGSDVQDALKRDQPGSGVPGARQRVAGMCRSSRGDQDGEVSGSPRDTTPHPVSVTTGLLITRPGENGLKWLLLIAKLVKSIKFNGCHFFPSKCIAFY